MPRSAISQLRTARNLRRELVEKANRKADAKIAAMVDQAVTDGATMTACAKALEMSRPALYELVKRAR